MPKKITLSIEELSQIINSRRKTLFFRYGDIRRLFAVHSYLKHFLVV